jgi:hypothetical protein
MGSAGIDLAAIFEKYAGRIEEMPDDLLQLANAAELAKKRGR